MAEWFQMLYEARVRLHLSQAELAARSNVSLPSVKAYEQGRRHPSRPYLTAMLEALHLERSQRNAIMAAAGYATDGLTVGPWTRPNFMYTLDEASVHIENYRWPAFAATEFMEVCAANSIAQKLWRTDVTTEFPGLPARSVVNFASDPRFVERIENLDEAFKVIAAGFKGHPRRPERLDEPNPYVAAAIQRLLMGEKKYVDAFMAAWETATPAEPKVRWNYPLVWRDDALGNFTFTCLVTPASEPDGLVFHDWIPANAPTWARLEELAASTRGCH
jgi:transcriptional regulator with XRE-family HTH domain